MRAVNKNLYKDLFSAKRGLIIHSSALCDGTSAYVFGGVSGSGKSTMAQKMNGIMVPINDEKNVLEFTDQGIKVSTYFFLDGDEPKQYIVNENVSGILKTFFFIKKDPLLKSRHELINDRSKIWKMLLTCAAPPYTGEDHLFPDYLQLIDKLSDAVPFYCFYHNLSDPPELIAKLLRETC